MLPGNVSSNINSFRHTVFPLTVVIEGSQLKELSGSKVVVLGVVLVVVVVLYGIGVVRCVVLCVVVDLVLYLDVVVRPFEKVIKIRLTVQ